MPVVVHTTPPAPAVLVAAIPVVADRLQRILAGHRVTGVLTMEQAQLAVEGERFGLLLLDVYFEESRMFELMSFARATVLSRETPIVCVLGLRRSLSQVTIRMLEQTVNAMWATEFLNLSELPDDDGGNAAARQFLSRHLGPLPPPAPEPGAALLRPSL